MSQTVPVVENHAGFRSWTRSLLVTEGFQVEGEAADGASALTAVREPRPDLVVLDLMLPDTRGLVAANQLAALAEPSIDVTAAGFTFKPDLSRARLLALLGHA